MSLAYIIERGEDLFLVDAGMPGEEKKVLKQLHALPASRLRLIFITHAHLDHYGCAAELRRITGAPIAVHQADAAAMSLGQTRLGTARSRGRLLYAIMPLVERVMRPEETEADVIVKDGDDLSSFGLPASVLHTPGHTMGSSCLIVDDRIAFSGDLVTNRDQPRLQRFYAEDWSMLPGSLRRLQDVAPVSTYPGHGHPIDQAALKQI